MPLSPNASLLQPVSDAPISRLQNAIDHHTAGQLAHAEAIYRELLATNPDDADALCLCGVLAQQRGQHEAALALMRRAWALQPDNPSIVHTLANTLRELKQFPESAELYARAVQLAPHNRAALFNYAAVLQLLQRFPEAVDCYGKILLVDNQDAPAHNDMGAALIAMQQYDRAAVSVAQALALHPDYAEAHNNRGVICRSQQNIDGAIASYQQALRCKPDNGRALVNLAAIYFERKEYDRAIPLYRQYLALDPRQYEAQQNMAIMLREQGKLDEAQLHQNLAYQVKPVFIYSAEKPRKTVLVLWTAGAGNVPIRHLFPATAYTRICCVVEYMSDADMRKLPDYDLVFNAIGDRDAIDAAEGAVKRFQSQCSKPWMNTLDAVRATARDHVPVLFSAISPVVCSPTLRSPIADFKQAVLSAPALRFPIIVRPGESHGGAHLIKLESPADLQTQPLAPAPVYYASNYVDYRSGDGYFRKYRMLFVNRVAFPYHLAIGTQWMVHYQTADMESAEWKLQEERAYLENPRAVLGQAAMDALEHIGRTMDLDYCGVDFSLLADGRILVFEANATMLVHDEEDSGALAHKNPYVQKILDAFTCHVDRLTS